MKLGDIVKIHGKEYRINGLCSDGRIFAQDYPQPFRIYDITKFFLTEKGKTGTEKE